MADDVNSIQFTPKKFKQLKREYQAAVDNKQQTFMFDGKHELLVDYTKYMIQYLETKF